MYCKNCPKQPTCIKICKPLKLFLNRKEPNRLYSDRTIERREIPIDPNVLETTIVQRWLDRRFGKQVGILEA
jgi:hypothetical protein